MMDENAPASPAFEAWNSYWHFARHVRQTQRFVWDAQVQTFLDTVRATCTAREVQLKAGYILFRAQRGVDWGIVTDSEGNEVDEEPQGYTGERMKPRPGRAVEGRANPAGIPILYLGTTAKTSISEVRPLIGGHVSLAQFETTRDLTLLDLTRYHGKTSFSEVGFEHLLKQTQPPIEVRERTVWIDIDNAFSMPVTASDDAADYVPTQILAELFRSAGYDGIVYKSQFDDAGFNIALFNVDDAEAINCAPYKVKKIDIEAEENGRRWFSRKYRSGPDPEAAG